VGSSVGVREGTCDGTSVGDRLVGGWVGAWLVGKCVGGKVSVGEKVVVEQPEHLLTKKVTMPSRVVRGSVTVPVTVLRKTLKLPHGEPMVSPDCTHPAPGRLEEYPASRFESDVIMAAYTV